MSTAGKPTVFISYSHKDEAWKNRLTPHLKMLVHAGRIDIWDDRRIDGGSEWYNEIKAAMERAAVAVCLISADYLASDFCQKEEIPYLIELRDRAVLVILPTLLRPCEWDIFPWLSPTQMIPRDGKSIAGDFKDNEDEAFKQVAKSILDIISDPHRKPPPPPPAWPPPDAVDLSHLPATGAELFGRQKELKLLDEAWEDDVTHVVSFVAWGGVGKSRLVSRWLERMAADNYRGARRVYGWSFYNQGTSERASSADLFINDALRFFGDPEPTAGSPWAKGERLAALVRRDRALLVLDGLEPLQSPQAHDRGKLKDPALATLLAELARTSHGLCVVTTREPLTDLAEFTETVRHNDLEQISDEAGRALLRVSGVQGTDAELEQATRDFGNHAFAVRLLAAHLNDTPGRHVSGAAAIADLDLPAASGRHPRRMMAAFERRFGESPEVELLRTLGLFDRPADAASLAALREPPIRGLSEHLGKLSEADWLSVVERLRRARLVAPVNPHQPDDQLDTHPLVREHFGQRLRQHFPDAWREGHARLYEHLKRAAKEYPDTLEEMAPLYAAIAHGCAAGRHAEALEEVYWPRVSRREQYYSTNMLGAFGTDLAALAGFFERPWDRPVQTLDETQRGFVMHNAGFRLRSLGLLEEAVPLMRASLEAAIAQGQWTDAAARAGNLGQLLLFLGHLVPSLEQARLSVELADHQPMPYELVGRRTALGNTLFQMGRFSEAAEAFRDAEQRQREWQPRFPLLNGLRGARYCDLLLHEGRYAEVQERIRTIREWGEVTPAYSLLDTAMDHLMLGESLLLQRQLEGSVPFARIAGELNEAVTGLRSSGKKHFIPFGLLARARLNTLLGDFELAHKDLAEALSIATRGSMRLHLTDCYLEHTRLSLAQSDTEQARSSLARASDLIHKIGYHRRDAELRELEGLLKGG